MRLRRRKGKLEFPDNIKGIKRFKTKAPRIIANDSLNWFLSGFRSSGGKTDDSISGWQRRKSTTSKKKKRRNIGRAILHDSGDLRRGLKKIKATFQKIVLGIRGIAYAARHNEGITDKKGREMPKREFLGDSRILNFKNEKTLFKLLDKVFKI